MMLPGRPGQLKRSVNDLFSYDTQYDMDCSRFAK